MGGAPGGGAQQVGGLYISLSGDTSPLTRSMSTARSEMDRAEDKMDSVDQRARALKGGFLVAAAGAAGLTAALGGLISVGAPIENTFNRIEVLSGATTEQMARMETQAARLGAEMPLAMGEITDSFYELSRAGFTAEESLAAVEGTANLAVAGMLSMDEASKITAQAVNAFGYEASVAGGIADDFASVASNTAADVRGLGDALRYVSTQAATAGMHASDLSNAIGLLSSSGLEASMAGTSLNAAISSLVDPTDEATEALAELGLTQDDLFDEEGNMRSMAELARLFADEMEDLSAQERSELLNQIFNQRGARAMGALVANAEELEEIELESALAGGAGAIERLQNLSDEELEMREAQLGFELDPDASREEILQQFAEEAESQEELEMMLSIGLGIDPGAAGVLAEQIAAADGNFSDLADSMDEVVTAADLAEARMDGVAGKAEYIRGSLLSMTYVAFTGAAPALELIGDVAISVVDTLGEMPWLLEAAGAALAVATVGAIGLAGALGAAIVQMKIMQVQQGSLITQTYGYATAQRIAASSTRATASAQWLMTASTSQLTTRLLAGRVAALAASAGSITLAGAATTAAGAMGTAATAALGLMVALGPIGWVVLAVVAAWAAWKSGLLDWLGIGAEAEMVASAIGATVGWLGDVFGGTISATGSFLGILGKLLGIFIKILALPITLPISMFGAAMRNSAEAAGVLTGHIGGLTDRLTAAHMVMAAFPPLAVAAFLWNLAGGAEGVREAFASAIDPLVRLHAMIESLLALVPELEDVTIIGTVAGNMGDETGLLEASAETATAKVASYFPSSDAERGALANLTEQGAALPQTFASGIENADDALFSTVQSLMSQLAGDAMENPLAAMITGPATTQSPQAPMSPGPAAGGAAAGAAAAGAMAPQPGPHQGPHSRGGPGDGSGRGRPLAGARATGGSTTWDVDITVHAGETADAQEIGNEVEGAMRRVAREEAVKEVGTLASEINQERKDMAGE